MSNQQSHFHYHVLDVIGQGRYGIVEQAIRKEDGVIFALKKSFQPAFQRGIIMPSWRAKDGLITEISCLKALSSSENILNLYEWCEKRQGKKVLMVLEFAPIHLGQLIRVRGGDLKQLNPNGSYVDKERDIKNPPGGISEDIIKPLMFMMLSALSSCYDKGIIHRDIKPNNFLLNDSGMVKLCDFGQGHLIESGSSKPLTIEVGHTWYKAPELLFGAENYGCEIDVWSVGCVLLEMYRGVPLFTGDSDIDQLSQIFDVFGTPSESDWPSVSSLPDYGKIDFFHCDGLNLAVVCPHASENGLSILKALLTLDPKKRITAKQALSLPYFSTVTNESASHLVKQYLSNYDPPNHPTLGNCVGKAEILSDCDADELTWSLV